SGRRPPAGSCTEYEWMVGPLVDGELPAADAEEAERHLQSCAACTRLAADFRSFDRLAHRASQPPAVSPAEWGRIWDRITREPTVVRLEVRRRALEWMVPLLSLAALALLAAWLTFALVSERQDRLDPKAHQVIKGAPEEPAGGQKAPFPQGRKG